MKFGNLLKKEIRELMTFQTIFGMLFTFILLVILGLIMGNAIEDGIDTSKVCLCDRDQTPFSNSIIEELKKDETLEVTVVDIPTDDYAKELSELDIDGVLIIPKGFSSQVTEQKQCADVTFVSKLQTGGMFSSLKSLDSSTANYVSGIVTDYILSNDYGVPAERIDDIKSPIKVDEYTVLGSKMSNISAGALTSVVMAQSMIVPFAIFFLLLMASQTIMNAISTEKIDKTLETLLSTPVPRITFLTAKMLAALIVALVNAVVTMLGFGVYVLMMTKPMSADIASSGISENASGVSVTTAMQQLNMTINGADVILIGISIFVALAIGLGLALILGALATDAKSVQTLITPLMLLVLVPFFVTLYSDIGSLSAPFKAIVYIIPFTHTYTAYSNLSLGHILPFVLGLAYQIVVLIVVMFLAIKLFTTDSIFTMKLNFGKTGKKNMIKQH